MNPNKILFTLLVFSVLLFSGCDKDDSKRDDSQALITVVSDDGTLLSDVVVKMYDEATYKKFENDNLTLPNEYAITNSDGIASFQLGYDRWFSSNRTRLFMFVVQIGGGTENYQIWSVGQTFKPGDTVRLEIKLTKVPA